MAPRQLPSRGLRGPGRPSEPPARLLSRAAQARVARARGRRPRLRHGRGADPSQRQPPGPAAARALHEQLPGRGPVDDRRAVGLAQHAEAGPHREPEAARGGDHRGPRRRPRGRRLRGRDRRRRPRQAAAPAQGAPPRLRPPGAPTTARVRSPALRRPRRRGQPPCRPGDDLRGRDPERASAPGRGPGLGGERHHEPPAVLDPRLEPVLRGGEPDRARAAARPGRSLREHGLPEPRPLPPGGGGAVRAHRRGAAEGGHARGGERSPGHGERAGRGSRRSRRPPPHRQGPPRPRDRRRLSSPPQPAPEALRLPPRHCGLPRNHRAPDRRPTRPRPRLSPPAGRVAPGVPGRRPPSVAARQRGGDRVRAALGRSLGAAAAAPPRRVPGGNPRQRAHHGGRAHPADERARGDRARRARRGAGPRQPRPAHPLRDPERLRGRPRAGDAGGRGDPGGGAGRHRGPERALRRGAQGPLLPVPPRAAVEPERERLDGMGAQARKARGVQRHPARGHRHELHREGRRRRGPAQRALLPHPRLRHAPAPGLREEAHRHQRPPLEPSALRRASRVSAASPRATGSCSRASA